MLSAVHTGNTTPYDLLAWTVVTWCVATALLRDRPRWWLGAGAAAGIGIEDEYLISLLIIALVAGILATSAHRRVLATPWPWLGGVIALVIWMPNLAWQFANGWPQLTADVAAQDQALTRAGSPPTSVYTMWYAEAGALDTFGGHDHLPPVISANNNFWLWGPGDASDRTVLVVDALDQVRPYFASCRVLTVYNPPDQVKNDWNDIAISVCTGPRASWRTLWPRLKHYD